VRLFLDTSVLLAASGSATGASRELFNRAAVNDWTLVASPYAIEEVYRNLLRLPPTGASDWARLRPSVVIVDDVLTLDRPVIFERSKDRPILFTALAWADVLLTLDRADFGPLMGSTFYGLHVLKPGTFLEQERGSGRLK
jgi:predicted nucleic acid-binding protein